MAEKKVTYLCVVRLLLDSTTALEGLFGPSAADEEWYSPKRPASAVVESNSSLTTQR